MGNLVKSIRMFQYLKVIQEFEFYWNFIILTMIKIILTRNNWGIFIKWDKKKLMKVKGLFGYFKTVFIVKNKKEQRKYEKYIWFFCVFHYKNIKKHEKYILKKKIFIK